ncbi:tRNA (guanosine(46)-N7)-methyltransferase TrmB [Rhodoligotrophos defluvii]|uniref:tRNA (guanosine(46)-N7)-methyltransferase TrmB n=1 Tax=Rhodoligotrophos defluvii TaxID=2561934 RepID=UPI001961E03F|nr:tRNA (guanosine(46)-N7)-methyltransferase TrmB [Rhodoligotrophos defluvii]
MVYGRRSGHKLRPSQAALTETLLPRLRLDPSALPLPLERAFKAPVREIWLEIGFGGAEHLLWHARRNPQVGFIGVEPFINGMAKLLSAVQSEGLANIRVYDGDARLLLPELPTACLSRAFVLFPDPWPKKRHNKRRIINAETLAELARVLKHGGELRLASDIPDYVRWMLAHARRVPQFVWAAERAEDWRTRPEDWPQTRYEQKAVREGRTPAYLRFHRAAPAS